MNSVLLEDIKEISAYIADHTSLSDKKIMITGASGLIGLMLVRSLLEANPHLDKPVTVIAAVRNLEKLRAQLGDLFSNPSLVVLELDINEPIHYDKDVDYIIHTASITASRDMVVKPVEVIKTTIQGTSNILDFAVEKKAKSAVYLSSLEVYGVIDPSKELVSEKELGYIDIQQVRNCYPESKRLAENMCVSYNEEYGMNIKIVRLTQTFGAGIAKTDNRLFAQLANSVVRSEDIVLHTPGLQSRCYCYLTDAIIAMLIALEKGAAGEVYNVANPETYISVRSLANMMCDQIAEKRIKVVDDFVVDPVGFGYAPPSSIKMDCSKIFSLGWAPKHNLMDMFSRLIAYLREERDAL